jgi:hypothetical protein
MARVHIPSVVQSAPPGALVMTSVDADVVYFIREDEWGLKNYPRECPVEIRLGSWEVGAVLLIGIVVRLARADRTTFDCFVNIGSPTGVRTLQQLAVQPHIDVHIATDGGVVRSFRVANPLRLDAGYFVNTIRSRAAWSEEDFSAALARLNQLHPSPEAMWRACAAE